jgi:predicted DCC family thiol-disulfide oxidoreductase YuxK
MISLASEFTDRKGQHARGWLFYDAECNFCTRIARFLARPMKRRRLGVAPLQDPRVGTLLGLSIEELLYAVRFLSPDGELHSGADAFLAVAREIWWARPLIWLSKIPGAKVAMRAAYSWIARHRKCNAKACEHRPAQAQT